MLIFACSCDDESDDNPLPAYTIEGKWIAQGTTPKRNTMYLYKDGLRYTYYCTRVDCDSLYNAYEANDGNHIPNPYAYTFENGILTVDINFGNLLITPVIFKCDGGEMYFEMNEQTFYRLNSDCN